MQGKSVLPDRGRAVSLGRRAVKDLSRSDCGKSCGKTPDRFRLYVSVVRCGLARLHRMAAGDCS
jgi:hypothetical protein